IPVTLIPGSNTENIPLTAGGRIHVIAHHPGGALASDQPVTMCRTDAPGPGSCPTIVSATTGVSGESTSVSLIPGIYKVVVGDATSPGESPVTATNVVVSGGATTDLDLTLLLPGTIGGTVRDANGAPISGASVTVAHVPPDVSVGVGTDPS